MTSKNSSGNNLVASVRKAKGGASTAEKPGTSKAVRKKSAKAAAKNKTAAAKPAVKQQIIDMFQSGRRVWPD